MCQQNDWLCMGLPISLQHTIIWEPAALKSVIDRRLPIAHNDGIAAQRNAI